MTPSGKPTHRFALATLVTTLALLVPACTTGPAGTTTPNGVKLVKAGQLTTCTHLPYAPFQFEKDSEVVGFDVALIDLVASQLGVEQVIVDKPFETIKTGADLNSGACDIAAAGMTISDVRKQNLDFSDPYFDATQAVLTRKGVAASSLEDVKSQGLRLGSQSSTTGEDYAHSHGVDTHSFESSDAELNGLRTGQVDAVIQDYPVVQNWLKDTANAAQFDLAANLRTGEQYGFAVQKGGNPQLLQMINRSVQQAKQDGTYKKLYEQWIGPMPAGVDGK
ncbi:transporter substrate-binding domain-containing protein [Saccharopolyspora shandongensis]|uniref:transporter substrate-binding domain-containing protein n=1 Tax=Saccharopolyspora shandongensis TaxID=418495 RepID=UPI0033D7B4F3